MALARAPASSTSSTTSSSTGLDLNDVFRFRFVFVFIRSVFASPLMQNEIKRKRPTNWPKHRLGRAPVSRPFSSPLAPGRRPRRPRVRRRRRSRPRTSELCAPCSEAAAGRSGDGAPFRSRAKAGKPVAAKTELWDFFLPGSSPFSTSCAELCSGNLALSSGKSALAATGLPALARFPSYGWIAWGGEPREKEEWRRRRRRGRRRRRR